MAYIRTLKQSAEWLVSVQNEDEGWGLTKTQASSLVNTSEAILVLSHARRDYLTEISKGFGYITRNWKKHLETRGQKLRFVAFPLFVASEVDQLHVLDGHLDAMKNWILSAQNDDGGWGDSLGNVSDIYSTYLAVQAIYILDIEEKIKFAAKNWILSNFIDRGWTFPNQEQPSQSATAYALLTLHFLGEHDDPRLRKGIALLLQTSHWEDEEAVLAGTLWKHSTHSNVLSALAIYEDDLFSKTMAEGIRHSNHLIHPKGGWMETQDTQDNRTVRAQYWAVYYSEKLKERFDPSKFIPRVDAERTETTLSAPHYQHFFVKSRFATVLPTSVYRGIAILFLLVGTFFALELNKPAQIQFSDVSGYVGILLIAVSFLLMQKRQLSFRIIYRVLTAAVGIVGAFNMLFGVTIEDVFRFMRALLTQIGLYLAELGN